MDNDKLPEDSAILLSYINTKLRDEYADGGLDALCRDMNIDRAALVKKLSDAGFEYDASGNRFW